MHVHKPVWTLVSGPQLPMEPEAIGQLERVAGFSGCRRAVGMPDLHAGPGIPIGACFAFDHIRPALIGSDAGCGVRVTVVQAKKRGDVLERRLRDAFSPEMTDLGDQEEDIAKVAWHRGAPGLATIETLPEGLRTWARTLSPTPDLVPSGPCPEMLTGLGTIGGGNHFAEISRVMSIDDPKVAQRLNINPSSIVLVVHSGSRGVGAALRGRYDDSPLDGEAANRYLGELAGAVRFADANRALLTWRLMKALGATQPHRWGQSFDIVHNTVVPYPSDQASGSPLWLHRKGAAPSPAGEPTVVLGSRGTPSHIMCGCGHRGTLESVAHGAGRRLNRHDAFRRFKTAGAKRSLLRTPLGGRVICNEPKLLFEEHPEAYKPIEPVVAALEDQSMATRAVTLAPIMTVKQ